MGDAVHFLPTTTYNLHSFEQSESLREIVMYSHEVFSSTSIHEM